MQATTLFQTSKDLLHFESLVFEEARTTKHFEDSSTLASKANTPLKTKTSHDQCRAPGNQLVSNHRNLSRNKPREEVLTEHLENEDTSRTLARNQEATRSGKIAKPELALCPKNPLEAPTPPANVAEKQLYFAFLASTSLVFVLRMRKIATNSLMFAKSGGIGKCNSFAKHWSEILFGCAEQRKKSRKVVKCRGKGVEKWWESWKVVESRDIARQLL